jgi:hypothetical protein
MSKQSVGDWIRQNSVRVAVEIVLADGEKLRGSVLVPKERSLREVLNSPDPFIEFDCVETGATLLSKPSIRSLRQYTMPRATQLADHFKYLESIGAWRALGLNEQATAEQVDATYRRLATIYRPEDYSRERFPEEIAEYVASVSRRLQLAYTEVKAAVAKRDAMLAEAAA